MSAKQKQLSNPFSTGGGGVIFETRVQAAFVILMLCGGVAPTMSRLPITKIKLQGKYAGFETDDFIAFVGPPGDESEYKLLAQIKHSLSITQTNETFGNVIAAAWRDFNNPQVFHRERDHIALITGPLSAWILMRLASFWSTLDIPQVQANFLKRIDLENSLVMRNEQS